jgi:uncharacterized protein
VPPGQFQDPLVTGNPHITVTLTPRGGHCAFIATPGDGDDGYWAETTAVRFTLAHARISEKEM